MSLVLSNLLIRKLNPTQPNNWQAKGILIRRLAIYPLTLAFTFMSSYLFSQSRQIDSLQSILKKLPPDSSKVNTLIALCRVQSHYGTKKIIQFANEALALSQKINYQKGEAQSYFQSGYYYYTIGNIPKALETLLNARGIYEKTNNVQDAGYTYNAIGLVHQSQGEIEEALLFFQQAYKKWNKLGFTMGISMVLENIGRTHEQNIEYAKALDFYGRSLKLSKEINHKPRMGSTLNAIGSIYFKNKDYIKSFECQEKALQYAIETGSPTMQARAHIAISQLHLAMNRPEEALRSAKYALQNSMKITSKKEMADSYYQFYKTYEKLGDYRKAFEFQSLCTALNDSLKNSENLSAIEKLKSRFELEKKESEIALLTHLHQAESFRRNLIIVALSALLIISLLLYSRYRVHTQKKLALKRQQLNFYVHTLIEKSGTIARVNQELELLRSKSIYDEDIRVAKIDRILQSNILTDEDWENFKKAFEDIYPAFFSKLRYKFPNMTVSELRLSALIKLNLSIKEIAAMLAISPDSVKTSRYRLKKKLGLTENITVENFIETIEGATN